VRARIITGGPGAGKAAPGALVNWPAALPDREWCSTPFSRLCSSHRSSAWLDTVSDELHHQRADITSRMEVASATRFDFQIAGPHSAGEQPAPPSDVAGLPSKGPQAGCPACTVRALLRRLLFSSGAIRRPCQPICRRARKTRHSARGSASPRRRCAPEMAWCQ